jgi:uncharacterized coiled-coil protein SlyX
MNDPKRIEEIEKRLDSFEDETNHNLTMLLGQAWKQGEQMRVLKSQMIERFNRLDDRVSEAHKELAELRQDVTSIKTTMATKDDISRIESLIMQLLQQKS